MFTNLLVPLDGSHLAEAVLIPLRVLAKRLGATITLLHIVEENPPNQVHGDRHLTTAEEARAYLQAVAVGLRNVGLTVKTHVHTAAEGDVSGSIVAHAAELVNDMIVLATHGRGGLRGILLGSIAQQVISGGTTPVLIVHPDAMPETWRPGRLAVALDGQPWHEASLTPAGHLARHLGGELHLFSVVPEPEDLFGAGAASGRLLPATTAARLDLEEENAKEYLSEMARGLGTDSLHIRQEVRRGDPGPELIYALKERGIDFLILATHALKGWEAFWAGSVTPRILKTWRRPVLLVKAH